MKRRFAQCVAVLLITCTLSLSLASCSQPIDTGSKVPAQSQTLVALLALVGLGIGLTALHHHNERGGGGPGPGPSITAPSSIQGLGIGAFDIAFDPSVPGAVGALGNAAGGGRYGFVEVGAGASSGSYTLPAAYQPRSVAIDTNGADWFVDSLGTVQKCAPPAGGVTTCTPLLSFSDGLPAGGVRSIAADNLHVFIAQDDTHGTVTWAAFVLGGGGRTSNSYSYTSNRGLYSNDAVQTIAGLSLTFAFELFHTDGASWTIAGLSPATKNPFNLTPPPSANVATIDGVNFYGMLGSTTTGGYQIGHWVGANNGVGASPGSLLGTLQIAFNGQINADRGFYALPLQSLHVDPTGSVLLALDPSGNLVTFSPLPQ
ncbi:MAG: hypothetical protein M3Z37_05545 [Candidatus Eremiobacteraeota bacterium]|nr:hypothetical protein [Candidatus Eremiobacteraeota bacterium]